ncbi:MAG: diguanylate cyclase [Solirubrobacteraceae bacterium]
MSFRNRLGLFFVLIVIVPMIGVSMLLFGLVGQNETATSQADNGARRQIAQNVLSDQRRAAQKALTAVRATDAEALLDDDDSRAQTRARRLLRSRDIERIVLLEGDEVTLAVGDKTAIAPAFLKLDSKTGNLGELGLSLIDAGTYAAEVKRLTGLEVVVRNGGRVLASTFSDAVTAKLAGDAEGSLELEGTSYQVDALQASAFPGQQISVMTLGPTGGSGDARDARLVIGAIMLGFLVIAVACAVLVSRSLQQRLSGFLQAARRLSGGDFSAQVQVDGRDEFAGLGEEFNKMSHELERRLVELSQERERVQYSMRRLGEALASKLDRDALLEIVVRTAVDGIEADAGRAYVKGPDGVTLQQRASAGDMNGLHDAVRAVEVEALRCGGPREMSSGETNAMAYPLPSSGGTPDTAGVVSVARSGRIFTQVERELFHYLAGQAGRSMENVDLHETATRESITDELTGLANRRAFDDAMTSEIERAKRFGGTLGVMLIDLDDFKHVNDTYGHPQGDVVLREVARVLRDSSREIDHPARYGGEELALVLPGTDLDGAMNLAERVRESIAALRIPRLDGTDAIRITASCGVAAVPQTPADHGALIAAADQALYQAKRSGKNKSVRAGTR